MAKQQRIDPRVVERSRSTPTSTKKSRSGRPGGRPGAVAVKPATLGTWIAGARPLTLPLAIVPVALGTAAASLVLDHWWDHWVRALLCLAVALALQIGVNYANDFSDGVRGADRNRVGPPRLVGSGRAKPRTVLVVAMVFFAIAAIAGAILVWRSEQWWLLAVGAVCLVAAWFYTGGKRPYGYLGLGEVAAVIFFGVVPTAGTMYVQVGTVSSWAWLAGAGAGLLAATVLLANNLRDRERDAEVGKRTLAVRLGPVGSRVLFVTLMAIPFGILGLFALLFPLAFYVFFAAVAAVPAVIIAVFATTPREYLYVIRLAVATAVAFGLGLAAAIAF